MFILFHLLAGLVTGYLLGDRLGTRAVVLPSVLGALLPDLVDKPVGILLLGRVLGSGRVYLHTLLFSSSLLLAGAVALRLYRRPGLLAVGLGVASHQLLDRMWANPRNWLYPFLGPFRHTTTRNWFRRELRADLSNPLEWVSGALLAVLLLPVLWPAAADAFVGRHRRGLRLAAFGAVAAFAVSGLSLVAAGALGRRTRLLGARDPGYTLTAGAVLVLTAYAAYRLTVRLGRGAG